MTCFQDRDPLIGVLDYIAEVCFPVFYHPFLSAPLNPSKRNARIIR
jgi:hypothetical protein